MTSERLNHCVNGRCNSRLVIGKFDMSECLFFERDKFLSTWCKWHSSGMLFVDGKCAVCESTAALKDDMMNQKLEAL